MSAVKYARDKRYRNEETGSQGRLLRAVGHSPLGIRHLGPENLTTTGNTEEEQKIKRAAASGRSKDDVRIIPFYTTSIR